MTRRLTLEGIENFRDFGDYETVDGRRLKKGRLFRSASHGRATDADLEEIAKLDIALVVDLRRAGERARDPSKRHPA
jgi:protein-tyrosine phosphatase